MRATKYKDGIKRIKAKIEVPMCIDDVSTYILSAFTSNIVDLAKIQKLNKRELYFHFPIYFRYRIKYYSYKY